MNVYSRAFLLQKKKYSEHGGRAGWFETNALKS